MLALSFFGLFTPVESIVDHLANCFTYDLSPKAFLETFFNPRSVISCSTECKPIQTQTFFMLRQNDVSLLVTLTSIPHLNIVS
uniref:Secreted protein n=1 Tax=Tetranychus urticae TaxID=32264 RepID=T1KVY7_TETUR